LHAALSDADVVVDVSNSPTLEGDAPLDFFETSGRNLTAAGKAAGVRHHVVLSVVGVDCLLDAPYFRAKKIQEDLIKESGLAYTIVRSTPFFEVISAVAQEGDGGDVFVPTALMQPIAAADLARRLADTATSEPLNRTVEVAGPEQIRFDYLATEVLTAYEDSRRIVADPHARYFGAQLQERSLLPGRGALFSQTRFEDWLRDTLQPEPLRTATSLTGRMA
jgi:uncharacterized protein YbjT (DUF2867 family)